MTEKLMHHDKDFVSSSENVIEQVLRGECGITGAAEMILELAYSWLEREKTEWQKTKECAS